MPTAPSLQAWKVRYVFVAYHGSWNRSVPTGYKVVRVPFRDGRPGAVEDFATGWLHGDSVRGRPVGLQVGADGALYSLGGRVFRGRDLPDQLPAVASARTAGFTIARQQ